eukprot:1818475-Heterocapsa_arctica.AAC.1
MEATTHTRSRPVGNMESVAQSSLPRTHLPAESQSRSHEAAHPRAAQRTHRRKHKRPSTQVQPRTVQIALP